MLKEQFESLVEKYMDMIYRVAYSWTKARCYSEHHGARWKILIITQKP